MADFIDKTMEAGADFAETCIPDAARIKAAVAKQIDEGIEDVRRALKRSRDVAEDLVDDAVHGVKKYPLQTVAATFGIALGAGLFLGWLLARRR